MSARSFSLTLENNRTEKEGLDFALSVFPRLVVPSSAGRKILVNELDILPKYSRAFDALLLAQNNNQNPSIVVDNPLHIKLVEVKTTKKYLPSFPKGFFFGATKNEFDLADMLGDRFRFCLVCLHPDSRNARMFSSSELDAIIRTKRIQYQINL